MAIDRTSTLMRIYVSESERTAHRATFDAIVEALAAAGIAGVAVFKGIEGFGIRGRISAASAVDTFVDLPILLEIVDDDAEIRAFIPALEAILIDGLVTLEPVQMLLFREREGT